MGLILDTSALVTAERRDRSVSEIFAGLIADYGEVEVGLSAVTIVELVHGIQRAKTEKQRQRRDAFIVDLLVDMTVYPVTFEVAKLAGTISGR